MNRLSELLAEYGDIDREGFQELTPVGRPRVEPEDRVSTTVRLPPDLYERLHRTAKERVVGANLLITWAVAEYLDRLVPLDELRPPRATGAQPPEAG